MAEGLLDSSIPRCRMALGDWLVETLFAERDRWPLWIPVAMAVGIASYFALPVEPAPWIGPLAAAAALVMAVKARRHQIWLIVANTALALGGGFAAAQLRTAWVAAPVLEKEIRPAYVSGRVVASEVRVSGRRLMLDQVSIRGLDAHETPEQVRVTLRGSGVAAFTPGQWVELMGALSPPPEPSAPDAYDFARQAYFKQLGGLGFAFGSATVIEPPAGRDSGG
jgi:competence protein ComEC